MSVSRASSALVLLAVMTMTQGAAAQHPPSADVSLDSLLNTSISAASKYSQKGSAAPGSVTIITSDDIKGFGYRNLQEVLESVRGFYISNDRSYTNLGTRGFSRSSDYNNRVLVLVDGHSLNGHLFGEASMGTALPLNLDIVERVEIVQGPGSALYGTGAVFAVINIVTKTAQALDGGTVRVGMGSGRERVTGFTAGRTLGRRVALTGSAMLTNTKGVDQYYPEYDTPATGHGIARGLDWDHGVSGYGTMKVSDVTVMAGYRSRAKGISTAPFGTLFGDSRGESADETLWGEVGLQHEWNGSLKFAGRVFADRARYRGVYPLAARPEAYSDAGGSTSTGTELMLHWAPVSRLRVTVGTEDLLVTRAAYAATGIDGMPVADDEPFHMLSGFVQSELQVFRSLMLVTGARTDQYSRRGRATTPRAGVIFTPDNRTTVKLLYGEAFRAPSPAEALLTAGVFQPNPNLKPERISTRELTIEHRLGDAVLLGLSGYRYILHDLIDQMQLAVGELRYENISRAEARGLEVQLEARPSGPFTARGSYALQKAVNATGEKLTNSPRHVMNLGLTGRASHGIDAATQVRFESGRRTQRGETSPFVRTDANLGYAPAFGAAASWARNAGASLHITNLFDTPYATPAGPAYRQDAIAADGRTYALRLEWRF